MEARTRQDPQQAGAEPPARGLVCLDLDGTLLDSKKHVSLASRQALRDARAMGVAIAFDSGRTPFSMFELMDGLGLPRTCVCLGGSVTYLGGRELFHRSLTPDAVSQTISCAREARAYLSLSGPDFHIICREGLYRPNLGASKTVMSRYEYCATYEELDARALERAGHICKISLYVEDQAAYARLRSSLSEIGGIEVRRAGASWADVTVAGCTKRAGVEALASALRLGRECVAAVGDADNDLDVLRYAGMAFAMGNATPAVRESAQVRVADNDHDGAAEAIRKACAAFLA